MSKEEESMTESAADRLKTSAAAEKRLLQDEREAERKVLKARDRLADAQSELSKAQDKFDRRLQSLAEVEAELQAAQQRRATGPIESLRETESSSETAVRPATPPAFDGSARPAGKATP